MLDPETDTAPEGGLVEKFLHPPILANALQDDGAATYGASKSYNFGGGGVGRVGPGVSYGPRGGTPGKAFRGG